MTTFTMPSRFASFLLLTALIALHSAPAASQTINLDPDQLASQIARYESGSSLEALRAFEALSNEALHSPDLQDLPEKILVAVLQGDSTYEAKRFACTQLAAIGGELSVSALAALLKDNQSVGIACLGLSQNPSPKAGAALRSALANLQGRELAQVIATLGSRRETGAVDSLVPLAASDDAKVAEAAIVALGRIASPQAAKAVARLREQADPDHPMAVCQASLLVAEQFARSGRRAAAVRLYRELLRPDKPDPVRQGALIALLGLDRDGGLKRILAILDGDEAALKPFVLAAVPHLPSADASEKLVARLPHLIPFEQALLIDVLAARGDAVARAAVRAQLQSADPEVRLAAINAEGQTGDASSVAPLARALAAANSTGETQAIVNALATLEGGMETDQALLAQLKNRMAGPRAPLINALAKRGSRTAVPALIAYAQSPDATTAKASFQALGRLGEGEDLPAAINALIGLRAPDTRAEAETAVAQVLASAPDISERSALVVDLLQQTASVESRCSLIRLLPVAAGRQAFDALSSAAGDSNPQIRDTANRALCLWPDLLAWEALLDLQSHTDSTSLQALALRGLTRLVSDENPHPNESLVARYRQLFGATRTDAERKMILSALAGAAHPEALKLAVSQLDNPAVRAEAALAVKQIAEAIKNQHPQAAQAALLRLQ